MELNNELYREDGENVSILKLASLLFHCSVTAKAFLMLVSAQIFADSLNKRLKTLLFVAFAALLVPRKLHTYYG